MPAKFPFSPINFKATASAVTGVLDDISPSTASNPSNFGHIAGLAGIVHRNNSLGIGFPILLQQHRIEIVGFRIDIRKIRRRSDIRSGIGRCNKGIWRCHNPISLADTEHLHGQVQGGSRIANCYRVLGTNKGCKFPLKRLDFWTAG